MNNHQAATQMLGYMYQLLYALVLLLDNKNLDCKISIEKFDDVSFDKDGEPVDLIQLKHHINQKGNLTDSSDDLWRTINVWIDYLQSHDPLQSNGTNFLIITTGIAPNGSAAWFLKQNDNRDPRIAYNKLKDICIISKNLSNKKYYDNFLNTSESIIKFLFERIYIIDGAENIIDVETTLRKQVRYSCLPKYETIILQQLEGWWFKKVIKALCSQELNIITQSEVRSFIVDTSQNYSDDNLPINIFCDSDDQIEKKFNDGEKIFIAQLRLICLRQNRMQNALRDYYRAFEQRASWVRNDLLFVDELEKYENRLIDEWRHTFAEMQDELDEIKDLSEEEKAKSGRKLLSDIERKDIRIRPKCMEPFIMRGSYHILADNLKVGWHIDFFDRLSSLLTKKEGDHK